MGAQRPARERQEQLWNTAKMTREERLQRSVTRSQIRSERWECCRLASEELLQRRWQRHVAVHEWAQMEREERRQRCAQNVEARSERRERRAMQRADRLAKNAATVES